MKRYLIPLAAVAAMAVASAAFAARPPIKIGNSKDGKVLTNEHGMTLYTLAKDKHDKSVCNGHCAKNWPPLYVSKGAKASGKYTVFSRASGRKQWALNGKPLYTFKKDKKPGSVAGKGLLHGAWHLARP